MYAKPTVGSKVSVVTVQKEPWLYATSPLRFTKYVGVVMRNEKWVPADSFTLRTGNPEYPVSVIALKNVALMKLLTGSSEAAGKSYRVESSKKDKFYTVMKYGKNYSCDCDGFKYRQKCRHIDYVKTLKD